MSTLTIEFAPPLSDSCDMIENQTVSTDLNLQELKPPSPQPRLTPEEILKGPSIRPEQHVQLYNDRDFEDFIRDWAYHHLQKSGLYQGVRRFGGAGDLGRDVVGFLELPLKANRFDIYQCKHRKSGLTPGEMWVEFAKLCVFTYKGRFPIPRLYYVVGPHDVGSSLGDLLDSPETLREKLISAWPKKCASEVSKGKTYNLEGELLKYVESFPFDRVRNKPIHEIIDEFRTTARFPGRFGGGLKPFPVADDVPPEDLQAGETRYVEQLLAAYSDHAGQPYVSVDALESTQFLGDLRRQRERFYSAETLRRFARDNQPAAAPYEDISGQMYSGVIDRVLTPFSSGYRRMLETMTTAAQVVITNHPLTSYLKPQSKQGICHQLANEDRIQWVPDDE